MDFENVYSPLPREKVAELINRVPELGRLWLGAPWVPKGGLSLTLQAELGWNTSRAGCSSGESRAQRSRDSSSVDRGDLRRSSSSWGCCVGDLVVVQRRLASSDLSNGSRQYNGGLHLRDTESTSIFLKKREWDKSPEKESLLMGSSTPSYTPDHSLLAASRLVGMRS